jgi:Ribonuclease G/E
MLPLVFIKKKQQKNRNKAPHVKGIAHISTEGALEMSLKNATENLLHAYKDPHKRFQKCGMWTIVADPTRT